MGKSRPALELAHAPGRVRRQRLFVALASLAYPALVGAAIARELGVRASYRSLPGK